MKTSPENDAAAVREAAHSVAEGYDALLKSAATAQCVLIGEASHGTHEFYSTRAELTRRLISDHGFRAVAVEADWPDSFRVHRFVTGRSDDQNANEALRDFRRFPGWMWRNTVVVGFVEWLRERNSRRGSEKDAAGFYGLDLYSMHTSIEAVLGYLDKVDPGSAQRARHRDGCCDHFGGDPQHYVLSTVAGGAEPCEEEVVSQLVELRRKYGELISRDGHIGEEEFFSAEQNARLVANAERYYRAMFHGRAKSWELRDEHMFETLNQLIRHRDSGKAKVVVWAHNSHLGDARATAMSARGEFNVGQLVRERFGGGSVCVGFTIHTGLGIAGEALVETPEREVARTAVDGGV